MHLAAVNILFAFFLGCVFCSQQISPFIRTSFLWSFPVWSNLNFCISWPGFEVSSTVKSFHHLNFHRYTWLIKSVIDVRNHSWDRPLSSRFTVSYYHSLIVNEYSYLLSANNRPLVLVTGKWWRTKWLWTLSETLSRTWWPGFFFFFEQADIQPHADYCVQSLIFQLT